MSPGYNESEGNAARGSRAARHIAPGTASLIRNPAVTCEPAGTANCAGLDVVADPVTYVEGAARTYALMSTFAEVGVSERCGEEDEVTRSDMLHER